ncbi:MAG: ATP-binding cassette domain-containing protein [Actinomycetota bacterium]|nr:ATP-binding cassette domain-containing protein [Actinomycetota bacterium]
MVSSLDRSDKLLRVEGVSKVFKDSRRGPFGQRTPQVALDEVSFVLEEGEVLGLVGESGSGKTTISRIILGLMEPSVGKVIFEGKNVFSMDAGELKRLRSGAQLVFQDPYSAVDPKMNIEEILGEPLIATGVKERAKRREEIERLILMVGLEEGHLAKRPGQLSGGELQRVVLARALSLSPRLLILDEPLSALDIIMKARLIDLLSLIKEERALTYLFISHDLGVVYRLADRVAIIYLGRLVEVAPVNKLFNCPLHPYTKALILAMSPLDPLKTKKEGRPTRKANRLKRPLPRAACKYAAFCPEASNICLLSKPDLIEVSSGHMVSCHMIQTQL